MTAVIVSVDGPADRHQSVNQAKIPPDMLPIPCAICTTPRTGWRPFQRAQAIDKPSALAERNWIEDVIALAVKSPLVLGRSRPRKLPIPSQLGVGAHICQSRPGKLLQVIVEILERVR